MRNQKGSLVIILGVVIAVGLVAGGFYNYNLTQQKTKYYQSLQQGAIDKKIKYDRENALITPQQYNVATQTDWKSYSNEQYKFSVLYPSDWQYNENDPSAPNLNKYHMTFFSTDRNTVLDLAVMNGNYEEAKKGLGATKKIVDETVNGLTGFSVLDEKGNKSLSYFQSPISSNETFVLTYLTKSNYETLENIKNSLKFSK